MTIRDSRIKVQVARDTHTLTIFGRCIRVASGKWSKSQLQGFIADAQNGDVNHMRQVIDTSFAVEVK